MRYWSFEPSPGLLGRHIDRIWFCRIDGASGPEVLLPTGRGQLIFGLDPTAPLALVQGQTATAQTIDTALQRRALGVSFRTGGLAALVAGPVDSLTDETIDAVEVIGGDARDLHEALAAVDDGPSAIGLIETYLTARVRTVDRRPDPAVHHAGALLGDGLRVRDVAKAIGLEERALVSRFRTEVGMSPKRYARLRRFEAAVAAVRHHEAPGLAEIAAMAGYADQAHMSREFRQFAATAPAALHRDASAAPNHVTP